MQKDSSQVYIGPNWPAMGVSAAIGLLIWLLPIPAGIDPRAWNLLAVFVSLIVGLIGKALPMGAMSLLALSTLLLTHTLTLKETLSGFGHPVVWLVVAAFLISRSIIKTGLGMRLAYLFVTLFGKKTLGLGYGLCFTELLLAPAMPSSTARGGGIIFPLTRALAQSFDSTPERHSQRLIGSYLVFTAYYANIITSTMFITAIACNPLIVVILKSYDLTISWGQWALAASVPGLICLLSIPYVIYKIYPPEVKETPGAKQMALHRLQDMGKMSKYECLTLMIFVGLVLFWILGDPLFGLDSTVVAFLGVSCLLISGVLSWDDIKKEQEAWDALIWFSTLVMMAGHLNSLGIVGWITGHMQMLLGGIDWWIAFPALLLIYFYSHYFFAGNTSHVTSMYAAFFGVSLALGTPPYLGALALAGASSLFACLTHYGTGCAPIYFGSEYISFKHWWRLGLLLSILLLFLWMVFGALWWKILGFW